MLLTFVSVVLGYTVLGADILMLSASEFAFLCRLLTQLLAQLVSIPREVLAELLSA